MKVAAMKVAPKATAMKLMQKTDMKAKKTAIKLVHNTAMKAKNTANKLVQTHAMKRPSAKDNDPETMDHAGANLENNHGLEKLTITPYDRMKFKSTMRATMEARSKGKVHDTPRGDLGRVRTTVRQG